MKFLFDLFPILLFFAVYIFYGIYAATAAAIVAATLQVAWQWFRHHHVDLMLRITFVVIVVLGGATLLLHNRAFVMWKPTIAYWAFAVAFIGSQLIGKKSLMERMMGHVVSVPEQKWKRLNLLWGIFFILLGFANLYMANRYFIAQSSLDLLAGNSVEIDTCSEQMTGELLNLCQQAKVMERQWAYFKVLGMMGLTFLFVIAQAFYLSRYMRPEAPAGESKEIDN